MCTARQARRPEEARAPGMQGRRLQRASFPVFKVCFEGMKHRRGGRGAGMNFRRGGEHARTNDG